MHLANTSRHRTAILAGSTGAAVLASLVATAATAPGITVEAEQVWETGVVAEVADGDTVIVDVLQASAPDVIAPADPNRRTYCDNRTDAATGQVPQGGLLGCRVRTIGVQAPEVHGTAGSQMGQCGAEQAAEALRAQLPVGTPVQLRSIRVTSTEEQYSGGRIARSVFFEQSPGNWVDSAEALYRAGLVLWMPLNVNDQEKPEYAHNLDYRRLFDQAAAAGMGLWSANLCGPGESSRLRMYVVSDPTGDDTGREEVVIFNDSETGIDVGGWTVRDSSFTYSRLPQGTVIAAHDYIRVHSGSGASGSPTYHDHYFNASGNLFANYRSDEGYFYGDSAYLFDSQPGYEYGNLRAWSAYPCEGASCVDAMRGRLAFGTVQYDPSGSDTADAEYVEIRNQGGTTLSLAGYQFRRQSTTYHFAPETTLAPGATLRLTMGIGVDTAGSLFLGRTSPLLTNSGDQLFIENVNSAAVDCRAWGTLTCPPGAPVSGPLETPTPTPVPPATTPATNAAAAAAPAIPVPARAATGMAAAKPLAPQSIAVRAKSKRLTVSWAPPAANGSVLTKYRARAYLKSGKKYKLKATCYASAKKLTCRTKKLKKGKTYYVKVAARSAKGYGAATSMVKVRNK